MLFQAIGPSNVDIFSFSCIVVTSIWDRGEGKMFKQKIQN